MITKPKKKKTCYCKWRIEDVHDRMNKMERELQAIREAVKHVEFEIYSAGSDVCIGRTERLWHRIVCTYEGDRCLGGIRPHWTTSWRICANGFSLESMLDQNWKGWHGQYKETNELKYDELPRDVLTLHHNKLRAHIEKMAIWYPCHIYNDFTGDMYRP